MDLVYYGNRRQLEYDFIVAPGADPTAIALDFAGADKLELDAHGDLVLHVAGGQTRFRKPVIYQQEPGNGVRREISGGYRLQGKRRVRFQVAAYDPGQPLVIDPTLVYATFLGGGGEDQGNGIAVDATGSAASTSAPAAEAFTIPATAANARSS